MNIPTLMTRIAALRGHPLPVSTRPAPSEDASSVLIAADATDQIRSAGGVRVRRDVEFARFVNAKANGSDVVLRMDVISPADAGTHPLVVYVPGGGFVMAPKVGGARMRRYVSAAGFVVASVEYRTTRQGATYRDGIADVRAAITHLVDHAGEFGIDPSRIGIWGESAGGYLAAMVGVTNGNEQFDPHPKGRVLAVVDKFGGSALERLAEGFDDATAAATYAPGNAPARYVQGPTATLISENEAELRAADPTGYLDASTPPFLLFHGTDDRLISPIQTAYLHHALLAAGVDSTRYLVVGAGHGDIAVKSGEDRYWTTVPMMQLIVDFLRRTLD